MHFKSLKRLWVFLKRFPQIRAIAFQWQRIRQYNRVIFDIVSYILLFCYLAWIASLIVPSIRPWVIRINNVIVQRVDLDTHFLGKPAWEWIELLIAPALITGGVGYFLHWQENRRDRREKEIATDRDRQEVLKDYLEKMTQLLLDDDWPIEVDINDKQAIAEAAQKPIVAMARSRTLTVLRELDEQRKGLLVSFLQDAKFIAFMSLNEADLSGADLSNTKLQFADLSRAKLWSADFKDVDLSGAKLNGADLNSADLTRAKLFWADLSGAKLFWANLKDVDLRRADLRKAQIYKTLNLNQKWKWVWEIVNWDAVG